MATTKQQLLLEYLISSPDTFALCKSITKAEYFDPEFRKAVGFVHQYFDSYNSLPSIIQIEAETNTKLSTHQITRDQIKYCANEIELFCRRKAIEHAILASPALIEKGEEGKVERLIRDAIAVSLNRDIGIDYFADPSSRLEALMREEPRTTTKWPLFDEMIGGGLARTELLLFSANSGGGKSVALANLAINFASQGLNVLYLSLELSEKMIAQRFDMMLTGIPTMVWRDNMDEIATSINQLSPHMGKMIIKRMDSGTNCNRIRGYLKEFELKTGFVPDLLIVDYLDIMGPNENVSADNVFEKDKRSAEQLRDILFDYNMYGATASQQNRSAIEATELNQGHIAGGISKVNTVDIYCSVVLTPTMKASGEVGFTFLKTRSSDGVGKSIYLVWDNNSLRILNPKKDSSKEDNNIIAEKINKKKKLVGLRDLLSIE